MLSPDDYLSVVTKTQVVSLDLLVEDEKGRFLVGKRINRPAQGKWFVPGGKIPKLVEWKNALPIISRRELGIRLTAGELVMVSDHIYQSNFAGLKNSQGREFPTHYLCVAVKVKIKRKDLDDKVFADQHSGHLWLTPEEIISADGVHYYTKRYFLEKNWAKL